MRVGGGYFTELCLMILHDAHDNTADMMQCTVQFTYTYTLICFRCVTNMLWIMHMLL
jgi:uncharacterized metal-binding protein YceD (DUF177 family)